MTFTDLIRIHRDLTRAEARQSRTNQATRGKDHKKHDQVFTDWACI
ncbi:MAG: hypothetical protein LJE68_04070 [Rhodobacter sp.]|nr:hypothetical protein [Rhodobacter sp.]